MVTRRPLVLDNGLISELLDGDTVDPGEVTTSVVAGSGLSGGGSATSNSRIDLVLAPNPSGLIYVGDSIGLDGQTLVVANDALASGNAAIGVASNALASGNDSLAVASAALASGNSALAISSTFGGGSIQTTLTAASAIASGYVVGVDDAGKAQSVRSVVTDNTNPISFPSASTSFLVGTALYISTEYIPFHNKYVVSYRDQNNSGYPTSRVGTVSGTSVSFGTAAVINSAFTTATTTVYDPVSTKFVIGYDDGAFSPRRGTAKVGTISGTSISFGSAVVFETGQPTWLSSDYDSSNNCFVFSYADVTNSNYGTSVVGTVSGTSTSYGTPVVFYSGTTYYTNTTFDSTNNKIVVTYSNASVWGYCIIGTVSGTSISFGTAVNFTSATTASYSSTVFDSFNNRIVVFYRDGLSNLNYATANVGTVSGTSISFGSKVVFRSVFTNYFGATYDSSSNRVAVAYAEGSSAGNASVGLVSGTTISFGAHASIASPAFGDTSAIYDSVNNKVVFSYYSSTGGGQSIVADTLISTSYAPTLNSYPNVLGISQSTVASGSDCLVNLPGSIYNNPDADYTVGAFYYANPTTSGVTTTATKPSSWDGQVPWNYIGRAVTSSGLMLLKSV